MGSADQVATWGPQPGPQTALLACPVEDVFYGGSRYGGKTEGLLLDFWNHVRKYGKDARGILFRRSFSPELEQVIARSKVVYKPLGWTYNETKHEWATPEGASLLLRYLDNDADADLYQGHQYTWMAFDELPNWPLSAPIDKLWACLRGGRPGIRKARRCTGNPGGPGHVWVRDRYRLDRQRCKPGVPFRYAPLASRPDLTIEAVFIPSKLEDNPAGMEADPNYEANLAASVGGSEALFRGWRWGDWDIVSGQYFAMWDPARHVRPVEVLGVEGWFPKWLSLDWGYDHPAALLWHAWTGRSTLTYRERMLRRTEAEAIGELVAEIACAEDERYEAFYAGADAFAKRQDEKTIAIRINEGAQRYRGPGAVAAGSRVPPPERAVMDRVNGWRCLGGALAEDRWMIAAECKTLVETLPLLCVDPDHTEDALKVDGVDDAPDSARYGLMSRQADPRKPFEMRIAERVTATDPTSRAIQARAVFHELTRKDQTYKGLGGKRWVR